MSTMQEAVRELPSPSMTFPQLVALFAGKGLDVRDLVWLSGPSPAYTHYTSLIITCHLH